MVRGQLRFLGTVAELRDQVATGTTSLEDLYLELTTMPPAASSDTSPHGPNGTP